MSRYKKLLKKKKNNQKAVLITAYDYAAAKIIDDCDVDAVLMGDSAAMVALGYESTIEISLDEIIMLGKAVRRGLTKPYYIVDMPFLSYQPSREEAIKNCGRVLRETKCDSVKMEGGSEYLDIIKSVIDTGIPVCGHVGMTPQRFKVYNGYPVKGQSHEEAVRIIKDAIELEKAGISMLIIENVPDRISSYITETLRVPVYSIGCGTETDGQIIVYHDILEMFEGFKPRFVKIYGHISKNIKKAVSDYAGDVRHGKFPQKKSIPHLKEPEKKKIRELFPDF
ncbi:MAG: 3-methyl-2-oxobutanoate hydroxymethyltransferase [bacterium]